MLVGARPHACFRIHSIPLSRVDILRTLTEVGRVSAALTESSALYPSPYQQAYVETTSRVAPSGQGIVGGAFLKKPNVLPRLPMDSRLKNHDVGELGENHA